MKKINLPPFAKKIFGFVSDKSPEILAIIAIGGVIDTARRAYKCSPKCHEILAAKKKDYADCDKNDNATKRKVVWEGVKEVSKEIAPVVIMGGITIASIIFSHHITKKRILALTAAYNLAEGSLKELNDKMQEVLGVQKARDIKDKIMADKIKENPAPVEGSSEIMETGEGSTLCFDSWSGRYFKSSANAIERAINRISAEAMREMYVSLNEFYDLLHIRNAECGSGVGWRAEDAIGGQIPITISAQLTDDQRPCLCIDYNNSLAMI